MVLWHRYMSIVHKRDCNPGTLYQTRDPGFFFVPRSRDPGLVRNASKRD